MARRKKPCEFCEEELASDEYIEHANGYCMWYEFYPDNQMFTVICQARDEAGEAIEDAITFDFQYCPMCGRKLSED